MLAQNVLAVFKISKNKNSKTFNDNVLQVYIPNPDNPSLFFEEIYAEESIKENCEKNIWNLFKTKNFIFSKHSFYDNVILNNETRLLQCGSSCILKEDIPNSENWFTITFKKDEIILSNDNKTFNFKYNISNNELFIISSNILFQQNHSVILLEILLNLRHLFNHTDIAFYITNERSPVKIASIINSFNHRNVSVSTISKRFKNFF